MENQHRSAAAPDHEFTRLMRQVADGSPDAIRELYHRYGPHIRRIVRHKLHPRLRSQFDSVDFIQDVWASFFAHDHQKNLFDSPKDLVRFLVTLTSHKVTDAFRHHLATRRFNIEREHSLDSSTIQKQGELATAEPTPSQAAEAQDEWLSLLRNQPDRWQHILELWRYGFTQAEIAQQTGVAEKTVRRVLRHFAERLAR